jgi:hypothetical protein
VHRRPERDVARVSRARAYPDRNQTRFEPGWRPAPRKNTFDLGVLVLSGGLVGAAAGCFWLLYSVFGASDFAAPSQALLTPSYTDGYAAAPSSDSYPVAEVVRSGKSDSLARSIHLVSAAEGDAARAIDRVVRTRVPDARSKSGMELAAVRPQITSYYAPEREMAKTREPDRAKEAKALTRVATLESVPPSPRSALAPSVPRIPLDSEPKTDLVSFRTAPFPHDGRSYSDSHVLLTIPPGFDANRPAVMMVFFHGHGATLERDVRDRQKLPDQIAASGVNAVLVAPQFAYDAADSNPGKFSDSGGFKRFLDEAALELGKLHGDPRTVQTFANMPIVIVAYSGGFGPTLAVLDHGGISKSRLRGIVLLDALYSGIDRFANWIAENRSGFFVSSYTPHTRGHNADLESELRAKSVPYGSELRPDHMAGSVTFLPAGDISHRSFVTHAWVDSPVKDILLRLDEYDTRVQTAKNGQGSSPLAAASAPTHN